MTLDGSMMDPQVMHGHQSYSPASALHEYRLEPPVLSDPESVWEECRNLCLNTCLGEFTQESLGAFWRMWEEIS